MITTLMATDCQHGMIAATWDGFLCHHREQARHPRLGSQERCAAPSSLGHLHDRPARYLVLRRAGKVQEMSHGRIIETPRAHDATAARQAMLYELNETRDGILGKVRQEDGALWHIAAAK